MTSLFFRDWGGLDNVRSGFTNVGLNATYEAYANRYNYIFDKSYYVDWGYMLELQQQQVKDNNQINVLTTCVSPIHSNITGRSFDG
jgi:hypothetical protein